MAAWNPRANDIFQQAIEADSDEARRTVVNLACGTDEELRRQVDALLRAYDDAGSFLEHPVADHTPDGDATVTNPAEVPGGAANLGFLDPPRREGFLGRLKHYEVHSVVGSGGMGVVLRALDESLDRVVAIKVLNPHYAANGTARKRFLREAKAVAAVTHEHVVTVHAVGDESEPVPHIVMQFIQGVSLQERLERRGPMELKEILRVGMQIAAGLAAAHAQGIVHRDIKPANILLENGIERVKITDFGLARTLDDASVTQSGVIAGTPMYMSPEQAAGEPVDHRSDLFSLGSVLYAMCTGHPPFRASGTMAVMKRVIEDAPRPVREANPEIPEWLEAIIARLHAKKPAERFQSATEVAQLLEQHLAHLQQPSQVPMPARVARPLAPRRRRWPMAVAFVLVAGMAALWFGPTLRLYVLGRGELSVDDLNPEFAEFLVVEDPPVSSLNAGIGNAPEPAQWRIKPFQKLTLPAGMYWVEAMGPRGETAQRWREVGGGLFSSYTAQQDGKRCRVEIKRGERVQVSIAMWDVPGPEAASRSIAGDWDSDWGRVTLTHGPLKGSEHATFSGTWDNGSDSRGQLLKGVYDPDTGSILTRYVDEGNGDQGTAELRALPGGQGIVGTWIGESGNTGVWSMWRKDRPPVSLAAQRIFGAWSSEHGNVTICPMPSLWGSWIAGYYSPRPGKRYAFKNARLDPAPGRLHFETDEDGVAGQAVFLLSPDGKELAGAWVNSRGQRGFWTLNRRPLAALPERETDDLKRLVSLQEKEVERVRIRYRAGLLAQDAVVRAEAGLLEERIRLATAEGKPAVVIDLLRELVGKCQEEVRFVKLQYDAKKVSQEEVGAAEKAVIEAQIRLRRAEAGGTSSPGGASPRSGMP